MAAHDLAHRAVGQVKAALVLAALTAGIAGISATAPAQAPIPADLKAGATAYDALCSFCHGDAAGGGQGPPLVGVVGRKAAAAPGFAYSEALKASGITWTPDRLDVFLTDPAKAVPGTAMPMIVPDPVERRNLIAFLETLH
jgi:cytochrome c